MEKPRPPNPLRAFEGLSIDAATRLGQKMGYRVMICGVSGVSSIPPDYPKKGEIGFFTHPNTGLVKYAVLPEAEKPQPKRRPPPAKAKFPPPTAIPSRLPPFYPSLPLHPPKIDTSPPLPNFAKNYPRDYVPSMRSFDPYPRWPYNPADFYPVPRKEEWPKRPCAICKRKVIGEFGYHVCEICHGNICVDCAPSHKICQGKPVKPFMSMMGG